MEHIPQSVQPSTLAGISRLAKAIKKQDQITHLAALEIAAQRAGYQNYQHARHALNRDQAPLHGQLVHRIYLSAYWRDSSSKPRQSGLETIRIELPRPLAEFLKRHQIHRARNLEGFFLESKDHLEMRSNLDSQIRARELLQRAALSLQFIEATGLRPATNRLQRKPMDQLDDLPNVDHSSRWISPAGDWVFLDEPYSHATKDQYHSERVDWVASRGLHGAWPNWNGLYYPGNAHPHLTAANQTLLNQVISTVQALPPVIEGDWQQWPWISDGYTSQFISPAREASGNKRKPRAGTTYGWSKNAYQYQTIEGHGSVWKPDQSMTLGNHVAVSDELKRLCQSKLPITAYNKILEVRSELENWLFAEASRAGRDATDAEHDVYYGGESPAGYKTDMDRLAAMDRVRATLTTSYPDCKPRRDLLKSLATARALTQKSATR
ncbi:DUF5623 domain-containing protein [Pseudomonas delhiensis]|uniref:DUF5623 domain-containing protein n=1 Tax=Pseudomonas delhiensis TaxID=366289 RepID=UPI003159AD90